MAKMKARMLFRLAEAMASLSGWCLGRAATLYFWAGKPEAAGECGLILGFGTLLGWDHKRSFDEPIPDRTELMGEVLEKLRSRNG